MAKQGGTRRVALNLGIDLALTIGFVAAIRPFFTGLTWHEWLGLAVGVGVVAHTLLHRRWLSGVTRNLTRRCPRRTQVNWALDMALAVGFVVIIGSGLAISRIILPALGIGPLISFELVAIHRVASWATLALLGVKLALHGPEIARMVGRLGARRHTRQGQRAVRDAEALPAECEVDVDRAA
jgi:hypothetical protein